MADDKPLPKPAVGRARGRARSQPLTPGLCLYLFLCLCLGQLVLLRANGCYPDAAPPGDAGHRQDHLADPGLPGQGGGGAPAVRRAYYR